MASAQGSLSELRINILKALCDPVRINILFALKDGERCVCELLPLLKRSQSTVSKDLDILYKAGILKRRTEGKKTIYWVASENVFRIIDEADKIALSIVADLARAYSEVRDEKG